MEEKKEDEELELDFSKIKSFFSRKKKDQVKNLEEKAETLKEETSDKKEIEKLEQVEEQTKKLESEASSLDKKESEFEKKLEKQETALEEKEEELESEIDFKEAWSKIKSLGKKAKTSMKTDKEDDDEVKVDWKRALHVIKKHHLLILILIPLLVSIHFRALPGYLPVANDWAVGSIDSGIQQRVTDQINQQYPNLPDQNKNIIIAEEVEKFKESNKGAYESAIEGQADFFRSRLQTDSGQTYLIAIDPWFWYRHALNYVNNGHAGDEIKIVNGKERQWDTSMLAPVGREVPADKFHAFIEAFVFKILRIFNKDLELLTVAFYMPLIITTLAIIPAFFITRRFGGNFGAIIASLIVAVHPSIMSRTTAGFSDTDGYNVLFPLLITWVFIEAIEAKDRKKLYIYSAISGFLVALYSFAWSGWWHIFDFLLIALIGYIIYYICINRSVIKSSLGKFVKSKGFTNAIILLVIFFAVTAIFTTLFTNYFNFKGAFLSPTGFTKIKSVGVDTAWPNVFTTVAEQNQVDVAGYVGQIGGKLLFFIALIGISLTLRSKKNKEWHEYSYLLGSGLIYLIGLNYFLNNTKAFLFVLFLPIGIKFLWAIYTKDDTIDVRYAIILIVWLLATVYASTKGVRWIMLGVAPFSIAVGLALGKAFNYSVNYMHKEFNIHKVIPGIIVAIVLLLLIGIAPIPPFCKYGVCDKGYRTALNEIPSMNDAWYNSLDKINQEAAPDAIINSWWDFGHWFKAIGQRGVTFDGTTQNTPMAHFVGNTLLTPNEQHALGTLRMLDCRSDHAALFLEKKLGATYKAINLIRKITIVDRDEALKIYSEAGLSDDEVSEVIEYTHCTPPENYFITSNDMIGKSGVWAHFGIWNFERATQYNKVYNTKRDEGISYLQSEFGFTEKDASSFYSEIQTIDPNTDSNTWISPWPSYSSGINGCQKDGNELSCVNNFKINLETQEASVLTAEGPRNPRALAIITKEGLSIKHYDDNYIALQNGRPLGVALIPQDADGNAWSTVFMDAELIGSMFTRLYFMDGHGVKCFEKFSDESSSFGQRIVTWKVDWTCSQERLIYLQNPPPAPPVEEPIIEDNTTEANSSS